MRHSCLDAVPLLLQSDRSRFHGVCVMMKFAVAGLCFLLVSGCASQQHGGTVPNWLSATDTEAPSQNRARSKTAARNVPKPVATKAKKKRVVTAAAPKPVTKRPTKKKLVAKKPVTKRLAAKPKRRPAIVAPAPKAVTRTSVASNTAGSGCQRQLSNLPPDADKRSQTMRVQCFFIGRGEYLTTTGAVKSLQ